MYTCVIILFDTLQDEYDISNTNDIHLYSGPQIEAITLTCIYDEDLTTTTIHKITYGHKNNVKNNTITNVHVKDPILKVVFVTISSWHSGHTTLTGYSPK